MARTVQLLRHDAYNCTITTAWRVQLYNYGSHRKNYNILASGLKKVLFSNNSLAKLLSDSFLLDSLLLDILLSDS